MISFLTEEPTDFFGRSMYASQGDTADGSSVGVAERRCIFLGFHSKIRKKGNRSCFRLAEECRRQISKHTTGLLEVTSGPRNMA